MLQCWRSQAVHCLPVVGITPTRVFTGCQKRVILFKPNVEDGVDLLAAVGDINLCRECAGGLGLHSADASTWLGRVAVQTTYRDKSGRAVSNHPKAVYPDTIYCSWHSRQGNVCCKWCLTCVAWACHASSRTGTKLSMLPPSPARAICVELRLIICATTYRAN